MKHLKVFFEGDNGDGSGAGAGDKGADALTNAQKEIETLKVKIAELTAKPKDDASLNDKVKQDQDEKKKKDQETKSIESALKFTLQSENFLKQNESLLPKNVGELFKRAEKEVYDSPVQKANAIKAGVIQEFFSIQSNVDTLTDFQKSELEDYLKLTKNGKEERAQTIFENIFEPSLQLIKQIKKAEEIAKQKQGFGSDSDVETNYKKRLLEQAERKYMGVRK